MAHPPAHLPISVSTAKARLKAVQADLREARRAGSWAAVSSLHIQIRKADEVLARANQAEAEAKAAKGQTLTPEQAAAQLEELVLSATDRTQYRIFRRLLDVHPGWVEE